MTNNYNVGEPVCVYGWVNSIRDSGNGTLVYNIVVKDVNGDDIRFITDITEDNMTTVF